jgi:ferredoxin
MADQVAVDWVACDGRSLCAELLPERIRLDPWGYPIIDPTPVTGRVAVEARAAVRACPTLALRLVPAPAAPKRPAGPRRSSDSALISPRDA